MHSKNNNNKSHNFLQGLRPFSSSIPKTLKKHLKKGGYNYSNIVDNWTKMMGKKISDSCYPLTIKMNKDMKNGILLLNVTHGKVKTRGYLFNKIAYISDCNNIPLKTLLKLKNLNVLIIDCFRFEKHVTHLDLYSAIKLIKEINPKKAILTNMHVDLDYVKLRNILPANITPAFDGLSFNF